VTSTRPGDRPARRPRLPGSLHSALTGFLIAGGSAMFVLARIGAATGAITIPFDMHHVISQILGMGMLLAGLMRLR
jgi:hypothetical protein